MSLQARYNDFLRSPSAAQLHESAALVYIPTLTTINEAPGILRHLAAQAKLLTKKTERIINAIESERALCVDVETMIEFQSGGGAYLPGLDDNFVADKTVVLPMVHIVQFDADRRIRHVRLHWDQGSLLKQLEVIGARARNWPLRDGKDQLRLVLSASTPSDAPPSRPSTAGARADEVVINRRPHAQSNTSATGDPHASLALFAPRENDESDTRPSTSSNAPSVRTSAKPPARDLADILGGGGEEEEYAGSPGRSTSPRKKNNNGGAPKGGAGSHYHPIRLFEKEGEAPRKTESRVPNSKRYNHFEFGHGDDAPTPKQTERPQVKKHLSQWDFEDFNTPEKPRMKVLPQNERSASWSDDEDVRGNHHASNPQTDSRQVDNTPAPRPIVHQPRPDSQRHFEIKDEGTPGAKGPLATLTNVDKGHRQKDFDSQFEICDESPVNPRQGPPKAPPADQAKVIKGLDANWTLFDESPNAGRSGSKNHNVAPGGIKTGGDGMGGRKTGGRSWGIGDDSEDEARKDAKPVRSLGKTQPQQQGETGKKENTVPGGIKTGGDGMGGRKNGGGRGWGIGDDSEDEAARNAKPVRSMGKTAQQKQQGDGAKDFWDF
ncbi:hypothetical protein EJ06DRAFT_147467 [Trichodelitschia bisporula]|uniref:Uncharacterized protein n=1 Tax=Trichodelitschia bisporula TaxID=703511 RepID=A0A6G1HNI5_9PEZI|nr:hypothetical protein EJ06DRAFT_147467 [Trichodelitschia bisporula]